jgi:AcrR family transcriptional regulator
MSKIDSPHSYHHGDLKRALVEAAKSIVKEKGVEKFSLREAARRAGVSPSAPSHHFGDVKGLLTAVATDAFVSFSESLRSADKQAGKNKRDRIRCQGRAYIEFARAQPAIFKLMWRFSLLNVDDPDFDTASNTAFDILRSATEGDDMATSTTSDIPKAQTLAAWSLVHGYATLSEHWGKTDPENDGDVIDAVLACLSFE